MSARGRFGRAAMVSAAILALTGWTAIASAEPTETEKETARNLMRQGDAAYEGRDYAKALSFYQAAHAIMGVPTTGIALARAQERLGLWVEAKASALEASQTPASRDEPPAFTRARADASALARQLETRIPAITIRVRPEPAPTGLRVAIDGVPPASAPPHRLNPGAHRITATAAGYREAASEVRLEPNDRREVSLTLVAVTADEPARRSPASGRAADTSPGVARPLGYAALGLGFVGIAVGSVTGILSAVQTSDLKDRCPGDRCPPDAGEDIDRADTLGTIANVSLVAGGVAVVAGVVLLLTSRRSGAADPPARSGAALPPLLRTRF